MNLNLKIKVRGKKREDLKWKSFWESYVLCFPLHDTLGQEKKFISYYCVSSYAFCQKKCEDSKHENMLKFIISVDSLSELSIL